MFRTMLRLGCLKFWNFNEFQSSLKWNPVGVKKNSKRYSSYNSQPKIFKFEFLILLYKNDAFSKISDLRLYPMDREAKNLNYLENELS